MRFLQLFAGLKSHGWKYCSLVYCERKILLAGRKSTAYKTSERAEPVTPCTLWQLNLRTCFFRLNITLTSYFISQYCYLIVWSLYFLNKNLVGMNLVRVVSLNGTDRIHANIPEFVLVGWKIRPHDLRQIGLCLVLFFFKKYYSTFVYIW